MDQAAVPQSYPFTTCRSSQNRCVCRFHCWCYLPFSSLWQCVCCCCLFYFVCFLTLSNVLSYVPRVSRVDKPGLHSIKWSGVGGHRSPSCATLVGLSVTDRAKSATSLRPLSKGSKLMNCEAKVVKYFGICTTNGLSPIKQWRWEKWPGQRHRGQPHKWHRQGLMLWRPSHASTILH